MLIFGSENSVGFLVANFLSIFPRKMGLRFGTENFTTFFTAREEICHLELTLGASSSKISSGISLVSCAHTHGHFQVLKIHMSFSWRCSEPYGQPQTLDIPMAKLKILKIPMVFLMDKTRACESKELKIQRSSGDFAFG